MPEPLRGRHLTNRDPLKSSYFPRSGLLVRTMHVVRVDKREPIQLSTLFQRANGRNIKILAIQSAGFVQDCWVCEGGGAYGKSSPILVASENHPMKDGVCFQGLLVEKGTNWLEELLYLSPHVDPKEAVIKESR